MAKSSTIMLMFGDAFNEKELKIEATKVRVKFVMPQDHDGAAPRLAHRRRLTYTPPPATLLPPRYVRFI